MKNKIIITLCSLLLLYACSGSGKKTSDYYFVALDGRWAELYYVDLQGDSMRTYKGFDVGEEREGKTVIRTVITAFTDSINPVLASVHRELLHKEFVTKDSLISVTALIYYNTGECDTMRALFHEADKAFGTTGCFSQQRSTQTKS